MEIPCKLTSLIFHLEGNGPEISEYFVHLIRVCTQIIQNMLYYDIDKYTTNGGFDVEQAS